MSKVRINRKAIERAIYIALIVALAIYGFWDSVAAEMLIRAVRDAFSIIIDNTP